MSSIFSTQKRHTFLRRKYCFFWPATALSPPVGRWLALMGLPPPRVSAMLCLPLRLARHRTDRCFGHHLLRDRGLRRNRRARRVRSALGGALIAGLLALFEPLQR